MSRWFRFYDDALNDPKVQKLPGDLFKFWVNLLCVASKNDGRIPADDLPFLLRLSEEEIALNVCELTELGLLDGEEEITPHNWNARQFKSDNVDPTNAERQARYREKHNAKSNAVTPVTVTPTRADTEADTEKKEAIGSAKRRTRYDEDFENRFWKPYPRTPVMSKKEAFREWQKLSSEDQSKAIAAIPAFVAFLKSKPDHPAVHACRFLSQRRFDGFEAQPPPITAKSVIPGTPEFEKLLAIAKPGSFQHSQMTRSLDTRQPYYPSPELLASLETPQRN